MSLDPLVWLRAVLRGSTTEPAARTQAIGQLIEMVGDRVYRRLPAGYDHAHPVIRIMVTAQSSPRLTHGGPGMLRTVTLQLDTWSRLYSVATRITGLLEQILHGYTGTHGSSKVTLCQVGPTRDLPYDNQVEAHHRVTEVEITSQ